MEHKPREFGDIIGHERNIGGLDRRIGTDRAHSNAEGCAGECRRVVDPVTDHRDEAVARDQFFDLFDLVLGK